MLKSILAVSCITTITLASCASETQSDTPITPSTHDLITEIGPGYGSLTADMQANLRECGVDQDEFYRLLALDYKAFDQDFKGGWRAISYKDACESAAATLIKVYLMRSKTIYESNRSTLRWHTGQVLAGAGNYDEAIKYFKQTYHEEGDHSVEWNLYVDGTIAFLQKDKAKLIALRDELAKRPVPEALKKSRQKFLDDNPGINMSQNFINEPQNLTVMNKFISCFDQPYSEAYGKCKVE